MHTASQQCLVEFGQPDFRAGGPGGHMYKDYLVDHMSVSKIMCTVYKALNNTTVHVLTWKVTILKVRAYLACIWYMCGRGL